MTINPQPAHDHMTATPLQTGRLAAIHRLLDQELLELTHAWNEARKMQADAYGLLRKAAENPSPAPGVAQEALEAYTSACEARRRTEQTMRTVRGAYEGIGGIFHKGGKK